MKRHYDMLVFVSFWKFVIKAKKYVQSGFEDIYIYIYIYLTHSHRYRDHHWDGFEFCKFSQIREIKCFSIKRGL